MVTIETPKETIDLPSKGYFYPEGSLLASGKIDLYYATAKNEDILTNTNWIKDGTVIDRFIKSLIPSEYNYDEILLCDKDALMVATRIMTYGPKYDFTYGGKETSCDLSKIEEKEIDLGKFKKGENNFEFKLPNTGITITFKFLTHKDEKELEREIKAIEKNLNQSTEISTRLKYTITSVNGETDKKVIRDFVDKSLIARDSKALRDYIKEMQPGIKFEFDLDEEGQKVRLPINTNFFWPQ